jgi:hypothetical protein
MRTRSYGAVAVLILAGAATASAQTAEQVIERHITAIGGRAAHAKLRSRSSTGTITLSTPAGDVSGTIEALNEAPNKSRSLIQVDLSALGAGQLVLDQRFDGVNGYALDSLQGNHDITGDQLEALRNSAFPNPLLNYKELGATVQLAGKEKVGDRDAYVVVLEPTSGPATRYFIDTETYVDLKNVAKINVPQFGGTIEQTIAFSDYRDVDGVKLPFQIQATSTVQNFTIVVSKVEHNITVDESLFS